MTGDLVETLLARHPFRPGKRGDGTLLDNYFDGHRVLGEPRLLAALADELFHRIARTGAELVAGEVAAGAQLATAVALAGVRHGRVLESRGIRRIPKDYGIPGLLTSPVPDTSRFAVVDDVAGTGAAARRCVEALREAGHHVVGVFVILDRRQGAAEELTRLGMTLTSLFRLDDLASGLHQKGAET
ncbi:orotate phosphoribosyltransferase [Streptomyces xylophagus]|uniref:orotate phosphoribosyltransferase n=1 Tax=Streptomyces xylophagus TaxID=285514 RepID=UPI0005BA1DC7|nr:phosphoribosyltransferase family protein [Streptomyces xylophagus]